MSQDQFLEVIDRDEAERRFRAAVDCRALAAEEVGLDEALGRVTAADVVAGVDVPSFDRSNYDGYAVRAADTYGAGEEHARRLRLLDEAIATGTAPAMEVVAGSATTIATGGMLPRGADSVVMVEHTDVEGPWLVVRRATTPGHGVSFAGTDIAAGETVLRRGESITSRETGVLAAIGTTRVSVWRRPRVAIVSTGDELVEPGQPMRPGWCTIRTARFWPTRCANWGDCRSAWGSCATTSRRSAPCCNAPWKRRTWCCFRAERAKVRAIFPIARYASSPSRESSPTAWR